MIAVTIACVAMLVIAVVAIRVPDERINDLLKKYQLPNPYS